jgi:hypothetical protein
VKTLLLPWCDDLMWKLTVSGVESTFVWCGEYHLSVNSINLQIY